MGNRLSKIYTRTGDDGTTGLADGTRLPKDNHAFGAMGDIDELNSHLGMVLALLPNAELPKQADKNALKDELTIIQHLLFNLGGEIALPEFIGIDQTHTHWLEQKIDQMNAALPYLKEFILPKGSTLVCQIHIARSVARRAERTATTLKQHTPNGMGDDGLMFLNRLSDYLFVLARFATPDNAVSETLWDSQVLLCLEQK